MKYLLVCLGIFGVLVAGGCGDNRRSGDGDSIISSPEFSASIVRTSYGVPHITAEDFGGLGYGAGYTYAQDNYCVLMQEIVRANGQTGRYFGEEKGNLNNDFIYTFFSDDDYIRENFIGRQSEKVQLLLRGYAAGLNRYLADTGVDNLAEGSEGCRNAEWVRQVTDLDIAKVIRKIVIQAGTGALSSMIMAANDVAPTSSQPVSQTMPATPEQLVFNTGPITLPEDIGSNGYAIGANGSQTDHAMLLANSHFPWRGPMRWYIQHLTIPGEYDMLGSRLGGFPLIIIGHNSNLAWTHTVSNAQRFTFYELSLLEGDSYKYKYDDEVRDIKAHSVTIEVMLPDGTIEERTKNIYMSHYGPILNLEAVNTFVGGWPTRSGSAFTFRDANIDNTRTLDQYLGMGQASSVNELEEALKSLGIPWIHTIAADRNGNAALWDISVVPNVTKEQLVSCADNFFLQQLTEGGFAALNGSRSACEWGTDLDAPPGLFGFSNLPKLHTGGEVAYVSNSNGSYWLANPHKLLEGYSPLMRKNGFSSPERFEQTLRTRQGFVQAEERMAGTDGLGQPGFTIELLEEVMYGNRNLSAELALDSVTAICKKVSDWTAGSCGENDAPYSAHPSEAASSCAILDSWDGRFNNDSVGPALWHNMWLLLQKTENLWAVPFDPDYPVSTPNTLNSTSPEVVETVRCALGDSVDFLVDNAIPLDRPWGEVQFFWNGGRTAQIPIHGGHGDHMWSMIRSSFVEGEGYSDIEHGNSYIQTITWDESECPVVNGVMTFSQSTDPASPHYSDWTELYSNKGWHDMPYCSEDIQADKLSEMEITSDDK